MKNILALDLGTKCGWALTLEGKVTSGSVKFDAKNRWREWWNFLTSTAHYALDAIYYEAVQSHIGTRAAHVYGGFLAFLEAFCAEMKIRLVPVGVKTIKKHFTGKGNATKDDVMSVCFSKNWEFEDHNAADALALLDYAMEKER